MIDRDTLVRHAYQLQPLPQSCARLAALMGQPIPELEEITEAISYDPVLTAKLLRMANSSYFGSGRNIGSVREAVIRMGEGAVFGLAVAACAEPVLNLPVPGYDIYPGKLWQHSTTAALVADLAKEYCQSPWPTTAFTAALLHDLGKLILGRFLSPTLLTLCQRAVEERNLEPYAAEAEILSLHHGEVSGLIAQHWNLPSDIVRGVTHHHTPEVGQDTICFTTHLANMVARHLDGNPARSEAEIKALDATRERLGLTRAGFEKLTEAALQRVGEVSSRAV